MRTLTLILFFSGLTQAAAPAALAGLWVLDEGQHLYGGALNGMPRILRAEQNNDGLRIIEVWGSTQGHWIQVVDYVPDCRTGRCPQLSEVNTGKPFVLWVRRTNQGPSTRRQQWSLSADGLRLTIQDSTPGTAGRQRRTLTYKLAKEEGMD